MIIPQFSRDKHGINYQVNSNAEENDKSGNQHGRCEHEHKKRAEEKHPQKYESLARLAVINLPEAENDKRRQTGEPRPSPVFRGMIHQIAAVQL